MSTTKKPPDDGSIERRRVPFERAVSLKFREFRGFLTEYSANISLGGMFLRTERPKPPGSAFDFEILLEDGFTLIQGVGEVVWTRPRTNSRHEPAGMGVRFIGLTQESRRLIHRIVQEHIAEGGTPFDPERIPEPEPPPRPLEKPRERPQDEPQRHASAPQVEAPPLRPGAPSPPPPADAPQPPRPRSRDRAFRRSLRARPWRRWAWLSAASAGIFLAAAAGMYGYLEWSLGATPPPVGGPRLRGVGPAGAGVADSAGLLPAHRAHRAGAPGNDAGALAARSVAPAAFAETHASAVRPPQEEPPSSQPRELSRVTNITWQPEPGGLTVTLHGNGVFTARSYNRLRLEASPRELVRISGITRAFPRTQIPVGTPEVERIRVGYHRNPGDSQLHVVLDLTSPQVTLETIEAAGDRLALHLARP